MVNRKKRQLKKSESILPYLLVFIILPVVFYFGLFQMGGWLGIIIGIILVFFLLNKKS